MSGGCRLNVVVVLSCNVHGSEFSFPVLSGGLCLKYSFMYDDGMRCCLGS